jgi:predicted negative regulator of RcsB-dependent stress response
MMAIVVALILIIGGLVGYMIWRSSQPDTPPDVDPEQAIKAAVELHAIHRRLDVAWTKTEQRREGTALRREIAEALNNDEP